MILRGIAPGIFLLFLVVFFSFFKDSFLQYSVNSVSIVGGTMPSIGGGLVTFLPKLIPVIFFLAIIFICIGFVISTLQYRFFVFTLEEFGLRLRKGILNVEEITIPYRQMQDVDVTRSIIYRLLGLSRLVVFSAGHEQPGEPEQTDTVFDLIDFEIGEDIRILLGRRIGIQVIEHETEADEEELAAESKPAVDL
jgi:uncharacterized membrane protein YdbT with pleckstrin-like domain